MNPCALEPHVASTSGFCFFFCFFTSSQPQPSLKPRPASKQISIYQSCNPFIVLQSSCSMVSLARPSSKPPIYLPTYLTASFLALLWPRPRLPTGLPIGLLVLRLPPAALARFFCSLDACSFPTPTGPWPPIGELPALAVSLGVDSPTQALGPDTANSTGTDRIATGPQKHKKNGHGYVHVRCLSSVSHVGSWLGIGVSV